MRAQDRCALRVRGDALRGVFDFGESNGHGLPEKQMIAIVNGSAQIKIGSAHVTKAGLH
jgi:hypothetical protein